MTTPQEHWLRQHIPSWLKHQAAQSLDVQFYPPIYEEFFAKWPMPVITVDDIAAAHGDLDKARENKYEARRKVSSVLN